MAQLDVQVKTAMGKEETFTAQLDFLLPSVLNSHTLVKMESNIDL